MADVVDMRMSPTEPDHGKIDLLCSRLGDGAYRCWKRLQGYCAMRQPLGVLTCGETMIECYAKWTGAPGLFVKTLVELRLLDQKVYGYEIHDWPEHQPWIYSRPERSEVARAAALTKRGSKYKAEGRRQKAEVKEDPKEYPPAPPAPFAPPAPTPKPIQTFAPSPSPSPSPFPKTAVTAVTAAAAPPVFEAKRQKAEGRDNEQPKRLAECLAIERPRIDPARVSVAWETWDVVRDVLAGWRWSDADIVQVIRIGRQRYLGMNALDPGPLRLLANCAYVTSRRDLERIRVKYLNSIKVEPTLPFYARAKESVLLSIGSLESRKARQALAKPRETACQN